MFSILQSRFPVSDISTLIIRFLANLRLVLFLSASLLISSHERVQAQQAPTSPPTLSTEQKVDELLQLLSQPDVRDLLERRVAVTVPAPAPAPAPAPQQTAADTHQTNDLDSWAAQRRERLARILGATTQLPGELALVYANIAQEVNDYGIPRFFRDVVLIVLAGIVGAWMTYRLVTARSGTAISHDVRTYTGLVFAKRVLPVFGQGLATSAMFFLVQLSPPISAILLPWIVLSVVIPFGYVCAALCARLTVTGQEPQRIHFWSRNISAFLILIALSWAIIRTMETFGVQKDTLILTTYMVGLLLLTLALHTVWARPGLPSGSERKRSFDLMISFFLILLAGLWVAGLGVPFWLGIYIIVIPPALRCASMIVTQLMVEGGRYGKDDLVTVATDRGTRVLIIGFAVLWLIYLVKMHPNALPDFIAMNAIFSGLARGLLILLIADLVWAILKTLIKRRLERTSLVTDAHVITSPDSRLMTLLPILRNMLGILITVVAGMMALSQMGVEIAPLMASAGIFGIALGFGSQTLVKDIISGIFYMVDDAFRVGEYIQSGSYRGTVEAFSIRSVKLRHHRGPIFTVPFGSLGAVENMSRDWAIDKFTVSVAYDTDLALVKKLTKEIGSQIADDPEFGPFLIETVKLKGVEQFSEYGIILSFGMTVRPGGQQSTIRRRAYMMIKEAFSENGIEFASAQGPMPAKTKGLPKKLDAIEQSHPEE